MSKADLVAGLLWASASVYALLGGADFGAGLWQALAARAEDPARIRGRIERSLSPVWEANHTWLILILVVLWTAFPEAFSAIMTTLYIPISLAAVGIVLRGAGFAFGKVVEGGPKRLSDALFAASSILTPFFMGTVVGAIASGQVPAGGYGDDINSWVGPLPLLIGAMFVASGAYVSAVFLVADSRTAGEEENERHFARSALGAATVAGALAVAGLVVLTADADADHVHDGLFAPGLPIVILSAVAGTAAIALLVRVVRGPGSALRGLRPLASLAVLAIVWGWGVAQHPYLLPPSDDGRGLKIHEAAAPDATLVAVMVVFALAAVLIVPAIVLLFRLADRDLLE